MKLWKLRDPEDPLWGGAETLGAFISPQPKYGRGLRTSPLSIRWDSQARLAGDFTFPSVISDIMVKRSVGNDLLQAGFRGFELGPVEVRSRNGKVLRKVQPNGLQHEFSEILITKFIPLEKTQSRFTVEVNLGKKHYHMLGVAHFESGNWDRKTKHLDRILVPRESDRGFFVPEKLLTNCDLFRVTEFEAWSLCTDRFREFVQSRGYTNICFLEVGDTINK